MALTQRLEIRQSHALVMTPQLMQAIKLLQLSNLDLATYVEGELECNPLLERTGEGDGEGELPELSPQPGARIARTRSGTPSGPASGRGGATIAITIWKPFSRSRPRLPIILPSSSRLRWPILRGA